VLENLEALILKLFGKIKEFGAGVIKKQ